MSELPAVTGKQALKAFKRLGFEVDRVKGSHHVLVKRGHPYHLSVPVHRSAVLRPGLLRNLIRAAGVTVEEFRQVL